MDRTVVVTGGSSGIGRACVVQALAAGNKVFNLDIRTPETQGDEHFIQTDLRDVSAINDAFDQILAKSPITGLVNNAGFALSKSLGETESEDFARLVPLNLVAPALCAKRAAESMKSEGWGRIVNISSRVVLGKGLRTAYAATKGGLTSMSRVWALELAQYGITVNTVGPGPIATELFQKVNPKDSDVTRAIIKSIPVQRIGTAEDIANAVLFFLKRESGFVTGQTIYVCGGLSVGTAPV